jgi:flagellar biosynthesis/type III secretory pathway protein FliH
MLRARDRDRAGDEPHAPLSPEREALEAARAEIGRLEGALAAARRTGAAAEAAAREAGRREAASEAADEAQRRLAAIEKGIAAAAADWAESLDALEPLAALVARAVLLKLVESDAALDELVARSIARQMSLVRREAIAAIRVSAADFPDEAALAALAAAGGTLDVVIRADPGLEPGACRMELLLGEIELGVGTRWRDAADLLETLAREGSGG